MGSLTRREFLKAAGVGAAALAACSADRLFAHNSLLVDRDWQAAIYGPVRTGTTCPGCAAGCGLVVESRAGFPVHVLPNLQHPRPCSPDCQSYQAELQTVDRSDRFRGPFRQPRRGSGHFEAIDWQAGSAVLQQALQDHHPGEIAFVLGAFPDHLYDFVQVLSAGLGGWNVFRFGQPAELDLQVTLQDASQKLFGAARLPTFDLEQPGVIFTFGDISPVPWLFSPSLTQTFGTSGLVQGAYWVHFGPRRVSNAGGIDEWFPVAPGSEILVAGALDRLAAELTLPELPRRYRSIGISETAAASGVPEADLRRLARIFVEAPLKLAIPGWEPLGYSNGLAAVETILELNVLAGSLGRPGGLFFLPELPVYPHLTHRQNTLAEIDALVARMESGQVKALLVHGANPCGELPRALGFAPALQKVPLVISFSSHPDETSLLADYVLPDHSPWESWGYQKVRSGASRPALSALQPVVEPQNDTRATVSVLLSAVRALQAESQVSIPYANELDFLQQALAALYEPAVSHSSADSGGAWEHWRQAGGWWPAENSQETPASLLNLDLPLQLEPARFAGDELEFPLLLLPISYLYMEGTPGDPIAQIHPETARETGLRHGERIRITSQSGEASAMVHESMAIRPGVVGFPLSYRGSCALDLICPELNESGSLAYMATRVRVDAQGARRITPTKGTNG